MSVVLNIFASVLAVLIMVGPATAAEVPKPFAVLPFEIHGPADYKHLSQGIQSMLISRLAKEGRLLAVDKTKIKETAVAAPESTAKAQGLLSTLKADYLIWGSVTIAGKECSLDVQVLESGKTPLTMTAQTPLDGLIPALEKIAKDINSQVFNIKDTKATDPKPEAKPQVQSNAPANPNFVATDGNTDQGYYLNPEFRYAGEAETPGRWRSQGLPFASLGMVAADLDGDGKTEVVILGEHKVYVYIQQENRLKPLTEFSVSNSVDCLNINVLDLNKDGIKEIIVSAIQGDSLKSFVLNFKNGKFSVFAENVDLYFNVVRTPPDYSPTLVVQKKAMGGSLFLGGVREAIYVGKRFDLGRELSLPKAANVFNFAYLPIKEGGYKLILADNRDKLRVYTETNSVQFTSMESFAGSSVGLETSDALPGMGKKGKSMEGNEKFYFLPLRLLTTDLNKDGTFELIVNKNISLASQVFQRYRTFPQGELQSMIWDGVGLNVLWKTRRIKGTISDYGIADVGNNGKPQLYVCLNTVPGSTGVENMKTIVLTYALDLSSTSANAPITDKGED